MTQEDWGENDKVIPSNKNEDWGENDSVVSEKKNSTPQPLPQSMVGGKKQPELSGETPSTSSSPYAPESLPKISKKDILKGGVIDKAITDVALSNKSPKYKEVFQNELIRSGHNPIEIKQRFLDIENGKRLIKENTQSPYAPQGTFVGGDENKQNYNLGTGFLLVGDNDKAIEHYTQALKSLPPKETQTPNRQVVQTGNESAMFGQPTQYEANKNPSNSLYGIALAYSNKGDNINAQNFFIQALQQDPTNANAKIGLAQSFAKQGNTEEANKLRLEAADDYKKEALSLQIQADKDFDIEKQRQADYMNTIANGLEKFVQGDPKGELGVLGKLTPYGFAYHNAKEMGLGALQGLEKASKGVEKILKGDEVVQGITEIGAGGLSTAFSLIPQVAIFNSAIQPIKEAAEKNPNNKTLNYISNATDAIFAPVSAIYKAIGRNPEEGSMEANMVEMGNVIGFMLGAKGFSKIKDAKTYTEELKKISEDAQTKGKEEQALRETKAIVDAVNSITINELQKAAKEKKAKSVEQMLSQFTAEAPKIKGEADKISPTIELENKINSIENDLKNPELAPIHEDLKIKLDKANKQLEEISTKEANDEIAPINNVAEKAELNDLLEKATSEEGKKIITQKLKPLENDKENETRLSSEIGEREEPIQTEPNRSGSETQISGDRMVQKSPEEIKQLEISDIHKEMLKDNPNATIEDAERFINEHAEGEIPKPVFEQPKETPNAEDWSKDVESTAKALEGKDITTIISPKEINALNKQLYNNLLAKQKELLQSGVRDFENNPEYKSIKEQISLSEDILSNNTKAISEAYHKALKEKNNPELVKAVEDLLGKPKEKVSEIKEPPTNEQKVADNGGSKKPPVVSQETAATEKVGEKGQETSRQNLSKNLEQFEQLYKIEEALKKFVGVEITKELKTERDKLTNERNDILNKNPEAKEVYENFSKITKQLEEKGELKKSKPDCP